MLWARHLARRRFRAHPLTVSAIRATVMVLLCMARDTSTLPRLLSKEDTKEGNTTRSDSLKTSTEGALEMKNTTILAAPRLIEGQQEPTVLKKFERLRTDKPPVTPLDLGRILFHKGALAGWPTSPPNSSLQVMAETNSPETIWQAYRAAMQQDVHIPSVLLQRVTRVLVRKYAPTRETFIRLHDVLIQLQKQGDPIALWQWNMLIYYVGEGFRKLDTTHYHAALDIYWELMATQKLSDPEKRIKPNICTYTTLLHIAARTYNPQHVQHALSLLKESKLELDRVARLTLIPFYTHCHDFASLRRIARTFAERGEDIGIDGINAYLWAFGKWGRLGVAQEIYSCLRNNLKRKLKTEIPPSPNPEPPSAASISKTAPPKAHLRDEVLLQRQNEYIKRIGIDDLDEDSSLESMQSVPSVVTRKFSKETLDLAIAEYHVPDQITYTLCMQVFAFHGDLRQVLQIFREMLSTPDHTRPWLKKETMFEANQQAYRSLFMAFVKFTNRSARQARVLVESLGVTAEAQQEEAEQQEEGQLEDDTWIEEALRFVFESFLELDPNQSRPGNRTIRYLMQAFQNVTQNDTQTLIWVWASLEERFGRLKVPPIFTDIARAARDLEP